jgi:hypothetical protein
MKLRHTIFNSIALSIAGLAVVLLIFKVFSALLYSRVQNRHPVEFLLSIVVLLGVICLIGGGGFSNLVKDRLEPKPTFAMCILYCLSVIFCPVGIWGFVELQLGRVKKRTGPAARIHLRDEDKPFSAEFLRRAAKISWACSAWGFGPVLLAGCTRCRPLIDAVLLAYFFALIFGLFLGIVALLGVHEHGKKDIFIPAVVGVSVSGFLVFVIWAAAIVGFVMSGAGQSAKPLA